MDSRADVDPQGQKPRSSIGVWPHSCEAVPFPKPDAPFLQTGEGTAGISGMKINGMKINGMKINGMKIKGNEDIREVVKQKYGEAALRVTSGGSSCCGAAAVTSCCDPITTNLYDASQAGQIPEEALLASLGCGNPTALAQLNPGEIVLDLGSGGGIDVLLSARRVGPAGKAYGLDMTDEMLALANENKRKAGTKNVEFLKGEIENIPLPDHSVDVIISNCVINLSADKDKVLREAFRVLKPGGRFAVSDVVTRGEILPEIRQSILAWVGCIGGALEENDYRSKLASSGFTQIEIEPTRIYRTEDPAISSQGRESTSRHRSR